METRGESKIRQISEYMRKNINKGYTLESLKWALVKQGYTKLEIEKATNLFNEQMAREAPKFIEKPVIRIEEIPPQPKQGFFSRIMNWFR